jgi:hypothetical protein
VLVGVGDGVLLGVVEGDEVGVGEFVGVSLGVGVFVIGAGNVGDGVCVAQGGT